jgi:hypothetical protein
VVKRLAEAGEAPPSAKGDRPVQRALDAGPASQADRDQVQERPDRVSEAASPLLGLAAQHEVGREPAKDGDDDDRPQGDEEGQLDAGQAQGGGYHSRQRGTAGGEQHLLGDVGLQGPVHHPQVLPEGAEFDAGVAQGCGGGPANGSPPAARLGRGEAQAWRQRQPAAVESRQRHGQRGSRRPQATQHQEQAEPEPGAGEDGPGHRRPAFAVASAGVAARRNRSGVSSLAMRCSHQNADPNANPTTTSTSCPSALSKGSR